MTLTREIKEITTVDARRELTKLPEKLGANPATVAVTRPSTVQVVCSLTVGAGF